MTVVRPRELEVEELWREMHDRLLGFVARRTQTAQDAEDVVQDVFLRMQVALDRGDPIERLDAWMFRIARNAVIDRYRRAAAARDPVPDEAEVDGTEELRAALAECMRPLVDRLPAAYAEAVRSTDVEGLTQAEAARRAGVSLSGMRSRVQRGRKQLRELLDACCRFDHDSRGRVVGFVARTGCGCGD